MIDLFHCLSIEIQGDNAQRSEGARNETKRDLKKDERFKERGNRRFVFWERYTETLIQPPLSLENFGDPFRYVLMTWNKWDTQF